MVYLTAITGYNDSDLLRFVDVDGLPEATDFLLESENAFLNVLMRAWHWLLEKVITAKKYT